MTARAATLATLLFASRAEAFCVGRTCNPAHEECETDDDECVVTGEPLHWGSGCATFDVHVGGSAKDDLDAELVESVVERAFGPWLEADCGNGHPSLRIGTFGPVTCDESRFNEAGRNANIVMFRDDEWPHPGSADTYGTTMLRYDTRTGELWDADIELNSAEFALGIDGKGDTVDLQSILTHEIGHFLGLAHPGSAHRGATMSAGWDGQGTGLRTLAADDVLGICTLYPPDRAAAASCEPVNGFSGACFVPKDAVPAASCASSPPHGRTSPGAHALAILAALACFRRRVGSAAAGPTVRRARRARR
jgi:hypothetical protein